MWLVACFVSLSEATNALWMNFGHAVDSLAIFVKEIWIGQKRHKVFQERSHCYWFRKVPDVHVLAVGFLDADQNRPKPDKIIFPDNQILLQVILRRKEIKPALDCGSSLFGDVLLQVTDVVFHTDVLAWTTLKDVVIPPLLLIRRTQRCSSATDQFPQTFQLFIGYLHVVLADDAILISVQ